jgi:hypothetical protein
MDPTEFIRLIKRTRVRLSGEKDAQADIEAALVAAEMPYEREFRLDASDIPDFMLPGGIAVEVKLRQPKRSIHAQCRRYCAHEAVKGLVLVTATATGFPPEIGGKPCWVVSLGSAWL